MSDESNIDQEKEPLKIFSQWYDEMVVRPTGDPSAMILSTADNMGVVSSRVVLLKEFGEGGFIFYTNYSSRKAQHISLNPNISLLFYWALQMRQVRIEGVAEKVDDAVSDEYFNSRPAESRLGAWASEQSSIIESHDVLKERMEFFRKKYGNTIPRPPSWGGYCLSPSMFEFWQEGAHRLHNRLVFLHNKNVWEKYILAP